MALWNLRPGVFPISNGVFIMRKWVDYYLAALADEDTSIRLIIADVGDFPLFREAHPTQFINAGVSESNAIGIAAGLSSEGLRVFVYGVSSFFLYRAYEQMKLSIAYWNQKVTFIGVGFGWKYYNIGIGHFCPDDIALVQSLPGVSIHVPYKLSQLEALLSAPAERPRYIRLTANIVEEGFVCTDGPGAEIITYGEMVKTAIEVQSALQKRGVDVGLFAVDEISDRFFDRIRNLGAGKLIVIEDQCKWGGMTPLLRDSGIEVGLCLNLPDLPDKVAVSRQGLYDMYGLSTASICERIITFLGHE